MDLLAILLQIGLPNHPSSEPNFTFAVSFFLLVFVRVFTQSWGTIDQLRINISIFLSITRTDFGSVSYPFADEVSPILLAGLC